MLKRTCNCFLAVLLIALGLQVSGQQKYYNQMAGLNRVIINAKDSIVYAGFYNEDDDKSIKTDFDKYYFWFAANDIKRTKGGYDGKLLHGEYVAYFSNKDLLSKGQFRYGLKCGHWIGWYKGGEIKSKETWRKGIQIGTSHYYNTNGIIQEKKKFTDSKGGRIITAYDSKGNILSERYYKKNILYKTVTYQLNKKGRSVKVKPEKTKKNSAKNKKPKEKQTKEQKLAAKQLKKKQKQSGGKKKKIRLPKVKIQKFRQVVPGGTGA